MANPFQRAADFLGHVFTPERARKSNETPSYTVIQSDDAFEVRDYPEMLVAEVTVQDEREDAAGEGFSHLFDYISAKNRDGDEIEMTTPVFEEPNYGPITEEALDRDSGELVVRFAMPSKWTEETLPTPADGRVRIARVPAGRVASLRFSGTAEDDDLEKRTAELRTWIDAQGLVQQGPVRFAIYDPPFTPPPARRNEIHIPV